MMALTLQEGSLLLLLGSTACWMAGGWMIAVRGFNLRRREQAMVGISLGLVLSSWCANLLAQFLPAQYAFLLASLVVLVVGFGLNLPLSKKPFFNRISLSLTQWLILGALVLLFNSIGRGLAIFDDYQNLPTVSRMAAGDIPPHFPLNPDLRYGYHYFLLLFASGLMRLGQMYPWNALDLAHAITLALVLMLGALWTMRLTRSRLAAFLAGVFMAFSGGARWLLLLFPPGILQAISGKITLLGTGARSGPDLASALLLPWKTEGAPPVGFPFAFSNGINIPLFMTHHGMGVMAVLVVLLLLFTYDRRRHWSGAVITTILLAALALANEVYFGLLVMGFVFVLIITTIRRRSIRLPRTCLPWIIMLGLSGLLSILQGGMLTEIVHGWVERWLSGSSSTFFDVSFKFAWPPSLISSHLGILSFGSLAQFVAAVFETGPVILALPLVLVWGLKRLKSEGWFEAGLAGAGLASLGTIFIQYSGSGSISSTARLLDGLLFVCKLYSLPLLWIWLRRRGERMKIAAIALGLAAVFGGIVLFGSELTAIQKPVYSTFITEMDVNMERDYWDRLKPGSLIFDPLPFRAVTIFGRPTRASLSGFEPDPGWEAVLQTPDPYELNAIGFNYMYFDIAYWENLAPHAQSGLEAACVRLILQYDGIRSERDNRRDFRRLLDISACR